MRTTLSCMFCRKAKVKCNHRGIAPCDRCVKSNNADCTLTETRRQTESAATRQKRKRNPPVSVTPVSGTSPVVFNGPLESRQNACQSTRISPKLPSPQRPVDMNAHLVGLSSSVVVQAVNGFTSKYPELRMVHLPTLLKVPRRQESIALVAALLAAFVAEKPQSDARECGNLYEKSFYENFAEDLLSSLTFSSPDVQVAQALLIIAVLKGCSVELHKAWMYCGAAIRAMQFCYGRRRATSTTDHETTTCTQSLSRAIESRTLWVCFNVSSMIDLGNSAQPLLPLHEIQRMELSHPLNNVDFALSTDSPSILGINSQFSSSSTTPQWWDTVDSFEVITQGISAWSDAMQFLRNDGRKAPGMRSVDECPWAPTSSWASMSNNLATWRARQHPRLHYPSQSVAAHSGMGSGETFVFVNILYYSTIILLHREYFPFLPIGETRPRGPIEYTLDAEAPAGWWESSASSLFGASSHIANLLNEVSECGIVISSPFAGFCAFIAGSMNLYITHFPLMNLGQSTKPKEDFGICYTFLDSFRQTWSLGEGWIKTIQSVSLLYTRSTSSASRLLSQSRQDFKILHKDYHDFFGVNSSEQHLEEIDRATYSDALELRALGLDGEVDATTFNSLIFGLAGEFDNHDLWQMWN